jgi:hypothetical protein
MQSSRPASRGRFPLSHPTKEIPKIIPRRKKFSLSSSTQITNRRREKISVATDILVEQVRTHLKRLIEHSVMSNWAAHNPGVILIFCILGCVALGILFFQVFSQEIRAEIRCKRSSSDERSCGKD